ncbi:MAG: tetratricopeptide repeat protein [Kovacikia sp.]
MNADVCYLNIMERQLLITNRAIEAKSNPGAPQHLEGSALLDEKRYKEAIDLYNWSIQLQPDNEHAWYGRGDALANLGHHGEALRSFDRTIELNPENFEAWTFRGVVLIYLERYQEALESCDRALAINPQNEEAWTFRGVALQRLGRFKDAYSSYDRATNAQRTSIGQRMIQLLTSFFSPHADRESHSHCGPD